MQFKNIFDISKWNLNSSVLWEDWPHLNWIYVNTNSKTYLILAAIFLLLFQHYIIQTVIWKKVIHFYQTSGLSCLILTKIHHSFSVPVIIVTIETSSIVSQSKLYFFATCWFAFVSPFNEKSHQLLHAWDLWISITLSEIQKWYG